MQFTQPIHRIQKKGMSQLILRSQHNLFVKSDKEMVREKRYVVASLKNIDPKLEKKIN